MSAEVLREAAAKMRAETPVAMQPWGPDVARAVADWLEVTARDVGTSSLAFHAAIAAARAYLGETA